MIEKIFIKNYEDYKNPQVRAQYGKLCGIVGIILNLILCAIKIVSGVLIGSIAIIADGINNLSDAGSSIITLIGFKLSSMPADKDHPFGHQRYEYITGLFVSLIILVIGILLMKTSIDKIIANKVEVYSNTVTFVTISILLFAILIKVILSIFNRRIGKKINSTALLATSTDSLNDSISTSAVLISTVVNYFYSNAFIDGIMGILVSVFIIYSGIKLVRETISQLIGEAPSKEFVHHITEKVLSYEGVLGVHDLVIHTYGPEKVFVTVHAEVDSSVDINTSHDMIDNIEQDFLKENINLVIHMDPIETKCEHVLELKQMIHDTLNSIDNVLLFHDFRVVIGNTHTNMIFDIVVPINYKYSNEEIESMIYDKIKNDKEILNLVITFDQDFTGAYSNEENKKSRKLAKKQKIKKERNKGN